MIYLKPIGGLCNRLRTIDSAISICLNKKVDLTVLWVRDISLNCSFYELFEPIVIDEIKLNIIDCPTGFPENFIKYSNINNELYKNGNSTSKYYLRILKNIARGRLLNNEQKKIKNILENFDSSKILTNNKLANLYNSQSKVDTKTTRDMDNDFIPLVTPIIENLLKGANVYISSCYRLKPLSNSYKYFKPEPSLVKKINTITNKYDKTIGLHIRRSDHGTSKKISTLDKFINTLNKELEENKMTTFFLSTDDNETKTGLIKAFGDSIIFNDVASYDRNKPDAVKDAVVDLYCLSETNKIYGSHHSSFSQTAADIGQITEITVR